MKIKSFGGYAISERDQTLVHEAIVGYLNDGGPETEEDRVRLQDIEAKLYRFIETGYVTEQGLADDPKGLYRPL